MLNRPVSFFNKEQFCSMVEKAKQYIQEGDIFQIVLSNYFHAPFQGSLLNTYRLLRTMNPSPYMFYFSGTDVEAAGASPETLVKPENGILIHFLLREPDQEEIQKNRINYWSRNCWQMRRNWLSTICW